MFWKVIQKLLLLLELLLLQMLLLLSFVELDGKIFALLQSVVEESEGTLEEFVIHDCLL